MSIAIAAAIGMTFGAFCIWCLIRIINRRREIDVDFWTTVFVAVISILVIIAPSACLYLIYRVFISLFENFFD